MSVQHTAKSLLVVYLQQILKINKTMQKASTSCTCSSFIIVLCTRGRLSEPSHTSLDVQIYAALKLTGARA